MQDVELGGIRRFVSDDGTDGTFHIR